MKKELRLALVLNGGVSLAVWIGGVLHEIDRLRRGDPAYAGALEQGGFGRARVDVIAGASAGGINGALLAAAIQGGKALRTSGGRSLRDVWVQLGDLRSLTRSAREVDPPSLLHGDELMIPAIQEVLDRLLVDGRGKLDHPLYLYITSTDMAGGRERAFATSDRPICELDHRIVFRFSTGPGAEVRPPAGLQDDELAEHLPLDRGQSLRLARAARASSSFPGAFPPHEAKIRRGSEASVHYLVDGGILDNQPFDPVLDRISVMEIDRPVQRAVLYVVPYVTADQPPPPPEAAPGLVSAIRSSGLARDLPKLESLERVAQLRQEGIAAQAADAVVRTQLEQVVAAAGALYPMYRAVQRDELRRTAEQWWISPPSEGTGARGADETRPEQLLDDPEAKAGDPAGLDPCLPPEGWDAAKAAWRDRAGDWCWGFTKVERFARTALSWLADDAMTKDASDAQLAAARAAASTLAHQSRVMMGSRREAYNSIPKAGRDPMTRFTESLLMINGQLRSLDQAVGSMLATLAAALGHAPDDAAARRALLERLMALEVVSNATGLRTPSPPDFFFYRVSADRSVLDHPSRTPEAKLAGMQLAHFAAFLKRSWRVNDWMWGRLDAVGWIGTMLGQDDEWIAERQRELLREELVALDRAAEEDERAGFSATCDVSLWRREHRVLLDRLALTPAEVAPAEVQALFETWRLDKPPGGLMEEAGSRGGVLTATGLAAVASRAFSGSASALPAPIRATVGASRQATSLTYSLAVTFARAPAVGVALVVLLAAFGVGMAASGAAVAAWLTPAFVALALLGAWTSFGWLATPPAPWRALALTGLGALLAYAAVDEAAPGGWSAIGTSAWLPAPDDERAILWWITVAGVVAVAAGLVAYVVGLGRRDVRWPREVRPALGISMVVVLAAFLVGIGLDHVDAATHGQAHWEQWERWLAGHTTLRWAIVVVAVAGVAIPFAEVLARARPELARRRHERRRVRAQVHAHRAVGVGPRDGGNGGGPKRRNGRRRGVPVGVVLADLDQGDAGPEITEELR